MLCNRKLTDVLSINWGIDGYFDVLYMVIKYMVINTFASPDWNWHSVVPLCSAANILKVRWRTTTLGNGDHPKNQTDYLVGPMSHRTHLNISWKSICIFPRNRMKVEKAQHLQTSSSVVDNFSCIVYFWKFVFAKNCPFIALHNAG